MLTGFREAVLNAIPVELKKAIGAGIGLFITLIGFANSGVVVRGPEGGPLLTRPDVDRARIAVFVAGLLLTALLVGIIGTTALAIVVNSASGGGLYDTPGTAQVPAHVFSAPDFALLGAFSFGYLAKLGGVGASLAVFFDTMGTAVALGNQGGFLDPHDRLPRMSRVLLVDSLAAAVGGRRRRPARRPTSNQPVGSPKVAVPG